MQKHYCDVCEKEITPNMLAGGLMRTIERFPVFPIPGGMGNNEGGPIAGSMIGKQIATEIWETCADCRKYLWDLAIKRKEELTGKKHQSVEGPKSTLIKP